MARNGSGTYNLVAGNPVTTNTTISSTWANNTLTDIGTALTQSISQDGQTPITANLPMTTFKHTNVGAATTLTDYARADQVQNSSLNYLTSVAGTDTITASLATPNLTTYAAGQAFRFIAAGANTTTSVTLNINSLGAKSVTKNGTTALAAADIPANAMVNVVYDGTQFQLVNISSAAFQPPFIDSTALIKGSSDATKLARFEVDGNTTATTRVYTVQDKDGTLATLNAPSHKSSNYSVIQSDNGNMIIVDAAATITLPQISTLTLPFEIKLKQGAADGTAITITRSSTDTLAFSGGNINSVGFARFGDFLHLEADTTSGRWQVIADGIATAFSVTRGGTNQTGIVTATDTKLQWTSKEYDYGTYFDVATNYRYTPLIPATYKFSVGIVWANIGDQSNLRISLYKNGVAYRYTDIASSGSLGQGHVASFEAVANGTSDYFEIFVFQNSGTNRDVNGATVTTFFQGSRTK